MKYKGTQCNYSDWKIPVSVHKPPKRGWIDSTELAKAWFSTVEMSSFFSRSVVSENKSIEERKRKDGSIKKSELGKLDIPLWTPCTWRVQVGRRSEDKVECVNALVLDLDGTTQQKKEEILNRLSVFTFNAHSTFSNGSKLKKGQCFRVVIPVSRPVKREEWSHFWSVTVKELCPECDPSAKDPARLWYVHSSRVDRRGSMWNINNDGVCIDVDAAMQAQNPASVKTKKEDDIPIPVSTTFDPQSNSDGKYKIRYIIPERIFIQITERGKRHSFSAIINDWDGFHRDYRGTKKGYLNVICPFGGTTVGSAFLKREVGLVTAYPVYTLTSNATRTHYRSLISDDGIILDRKTMMPLVDRGNATRYLIAKYPDLWLDIRTGVPYVNSKRLEDYEIDLLGVDVSYGLNPTSATIGNQVFLRSFVSAAAKRPRDPLLETLESLPEWSPTEDEALIETFFIKNLKVADTPLNRAYSKKFFIGALARAYDWGCRHEAVLIIKGEQGVGKSSLWEALSMGFFVDEKIDISDKDGKAKLRFGWIIEMAELSSLRGKMVEDIRHFITLKRDQYREPWGYKQEFHPRRCVLVGSTNDDAFNLDPKGSRRLWIMESTAEEYEDTFVLEEIREIVPKLWAEAWYYYEKGRHKREDGSWRYDDCLYWLTQEEFIDSKEANAEYCPQDPHEHLIHTWLDGKKGEKPTDITVLDVIHECYHPNRTTLRPKKWTGHIPQILTSYGCTSERTAKHRKYTIPALDEDEKAKQKIEENKLKDKADIRDYYDKKQKWGRSNEKRHA